VSKYDGREAYLESNAAQNAAQIAALSGLTGVIIGSLISWLTQASLLRRRIKADEALAERKLEADEALAERKLVSDQEQTKRKADADIALAERKFQLDAKLADRKRRQDLAEEVLSGFYQVREIVHAIRAPMIMPGEAANRPKAEPESPDVERRRDVYYVPLARLEERRRDIGDLLAKRYRAAAWFGVAADDAFETLHRAITDIAMASQKLVRSSGVTLQSDEELRQEMERKIWWTRADPDPIAAQIDAATRAIEGICRPVLQEAGVP
jgi:hypothetical protein